MLREGFRPCKFSSEILRRRHNPLWVSEVLVLLPYYQTLVNKLHSESDEEARSDNESGTDIKLHEELVNLDDISDLDKNEEFLD